MEIWRIIATSLLGIGGLIMTLVFMAQVRDRRGSTTQKVVRAGLISLAVFAVLCLLVATVLPDTIAWGIVVAVGMIIVILHHIN